MCSKTEINNILELFVAEVKNIFGATLRDVILFGSYARGDYNIDSDVDIMVIADIEESEIMKYTSHVANFLGELLIDYDIVISPIVERQQKYEEYKNVIPFLQNVQKEGVCLVS